MRIPCCAKERRRWHLLQTSPKTRRDTKYDTPKEADSMLEGQLQPSRLLAAPSLLQQSNIYNLWSRYVDWKQKHRSKESKFCTLSCFARTIRTESPAGPKSYIAIHATQKRLLTIHFRSFPFLLAVGYKNIYSVLLQVVLFPHKLRQCSSLQAQFCSPRQTISKTLHWYLLKIFPRPGDGTKNQNKFLEFVSNQFIGLFNWKWRMPAGIQRKLLITDLRYSCCHHVVWICNDKLSRHILFHFRKRWCD